MMRWTTAGTLRGRRATIIEHLEASGLRVTNPPTFQFGDTLLRMVSRAKVGSVCCMREVAGRMDWITAEGRC